jgi:hypothetical protein
MLNNIYSLVFPFLLLTGLSACSDDAPVTASTEAEERQAGILSQGQLDALESANNLADTLQAAEDERRKKMEEQGI